MTALWDSIPAIANKPYEGLLTHRTHNRPLFLRIETVNTCNNLCLVCAYRDQTRPKRIMPMAMFEKAVNDYVDLGGGFLSLTPLVGDVLLDRHLIERLAWLRGIPGITELGVTTNGAMAHRFDDAELAEVVNSFSRLSISIYGVDRREYEVMTKRQTYHQMVEGIRRIVSLSTRPITLEFRLLNSRSKFELFEWLAQEVMQGIDRSQIAAKVRLNSVLTDYANWGIYDSLNTPLPADAKWFASTRQTHKSQCLIPLFNCMVFSDGNVSFCGCDNFDDVPELRIGNIMQSSLAEMYNSERTDSLWNWEKYGTPAFCQGCSFHIPLNDLDGNPSLLTDPYQVVGSG
jgi:MoaA/NifB/PqqE/SkfB family radical SAM enzyme